MQLKGEFKVGHRHYVARISHFNGLLTFQRRCGAKVARGTPNAEVASSNLVSVGDSLFCLLQLRRVRGEAGPLQRRPSGGQAVA